MDDNQRNPLDQSEETPAEGRKRKLLEFREEEKKPLLTDKARKEIREWVVSLAVALVVVLLIRTFLFTIISVDGPSRSDTLLDGDRLMVTVLDMKLNGPERFDVIICKYPGRKEHFVKRVMGVPGDEIMVISNIVFRNGEMLDEPYLTASRNDNGFTMAPFKLGEGEYFVMGDNRDNSHDSRNYYGWNQPSAITRDMIKGKVRWVVFPFNNIRGIE